MNFQHRNGVLNFSWSDFSGRELRNFSDLISHVANIRFAEERHFKADVVLGFSFATRSVCSAAVVGWLQGSGRGRSQHYSDGLSETHKGLRTVSGSYEIQIRASAERSAA